jgi:septal ring factor EnvC (AmiA/AmiB activator)
VDKSNQLIKARTAIVAAGFAAALLAACAATPPPNERLAVAKASVQRAEQSGAQDLAPVELSTARDKLQRAERAAADHESQPANLLAEQANVDAQLAEATAQEHRSHTAVVQLDASLQALRQESVRSTAPAPAPVAPPPPPQTE